MPTRIFKILAPVYQPRFISSFGAKIHEPNSKIIATQLDLTRACTCWSEMSFLPNFSVVENQISPDPMKMNH